jgi:kynurenine formamidase
VSDTGGHWPRYAELPQVDEGRAVCAWDVFGPGDQLGTINFIADTARIEAAGLVRDGKIINLDYTLDAFEPFPSGTRPPGQHHIFSNNEYHYDDWLDSFYLQSTTQIDALRHIGYPGLDFYQGVKKEDITETSSVLSIQRWAEVPIVGRGVLLDVARYLESMGRPIDPREPYQITIQDLEDTITAENLQLYDGDILLFRTGFAEYCRSSMDAEARKAFKLGMKVPGLESTRAMVAWLWDHHFSLVAADNLGIESFPYTADNDITIPGLSGPAKGVDHNGGLHRPMIPLLGFALGEMFNLEMLSEDCANDGRYDFFFSAKPLNLTGGVGSPANAYAMK